MGGGGGGGDKYSTDNCRLFNHSMLGDILLGHRVKFAAKIQANFNNLGFIKSH